MEKIYVEYLKKVAEKEKKSLEAVIQETEKMHGSVFALFIQQQQEEQKKEAVNEQLSSKPNAPRSRRV